ncbi:serine/threonine-protein phosphatase 7 long form-like protein [Iris pallida]|uniref:Serine/threonine-protein phosphatase 7 long form-like protein n=1 Tax=Iris pallida TaxID=29817 RepID=A0AAX6DRJ8_IRIPA|nr:serine/threonine-protein phosphatase 7 long form-like protein [Iris pallida]
MYHPADRVMRQFYFKQHIPDDPPCYNRGRGSATVRARKLIPAWNCRLETHDVTQLSQRIVSMDDLLGDIAYRSWWGDPMISNRCYIYDEPRFQHRAIDDSSLREFYQHIMRTDVPALEQAYENPNPDILRTTVRNFLDYVKADPAPPNPPLHIPLDYPAGFISQRQARPYKFRPLVTQPYVPDSPSQQADVIHDSPPQQAGQGTSEWAGQGTSQWTGEGSAQWAGQETSQWAGQGTSEWAGQGTSQ